MTTGRSLLLLVVPLMMAAALMMAAPAGAQTPPATPPGAESAPAAPAAAAPPPAGSAAYDVELGIRTLSIDGNSDMYRTQINEKSGLLLRSFSLLTAGAEDGAGFFDRLRIDGSDLGAGPAGSLRVEADRQGLYRFRLGYRHANAFSALPAFANPLLGTGIIPGQHTYDRTQNGIDADLELFPDRRVTPFVGLSLHRASGPGTSSYTLGGDEFRLWQQFGESERELRIGTGFRLGRFAGSMTQGWRRVRGSESLSLEPADGGGNGSDPLLGRPVLAGRIERDDRTRIDTPFTNLYVTGQLTRRLRLIGNYSRFVADSDGGGAESAAGSFVSFTLGRFFSGLDEQSSSRAKNSTWRGGARAEVTLPEGIVGFAGYQKEHRELEGSALIDTLFLQTLTFGGVDPRDVEAVLNANGSITRGEETVSVGASARSLGPFAVRVELRQAKQSVTVTPDLSEIVLPGNQDGGFDRRVRSIDTNASYTFAAFTLGAAWRQDRANAPIFRTDFRDRDRWRLRASWKAPKWLRAGVTAEETRQSNDQPDVDLSGKTRQYSGDAEVTPHEGIALRGSLTRFRADNSILFRRPENFSIDRSLYVENGQSREAGIGLRHRALSFDADLARFTNRGDNPFDLDRVRLRAGFELPVRTRTGVIVEYARDRYRDRGFTYSDFLARRLGLYLHYHP